MYLNRKRLFIIESAIAAFLIAGCASTDSDSNEAISDKQETGSTGIF